VAESESFCALDSNQRPWCWGYQAGYGPPTQTVALQLLQVSTGDTHSCGLLPNHAAVCWGDNSMGALGEGTRTSSPVPVPVAGGLTFRQIAVGENSTCAITLSGTAYCWGQNDAGQVGDGTRIMRLVPTRVLGQP
jgi:alpha-tubulin suppressor-like RCC1 family protein